MKSPSTLEIETFPYNASARTSCILRQSPEGMVKLVKPVDCGQKTPALLTDTPKPIFKQTDGVEISC